MDSVLRMDSVDWMLSDRMVLSEVSLCVRSGTTTVLLGENGAGKTSVIRIIAGLQDPTRGTVSIDGYSPRALEARRLLGVALQVPALYPTLTVQQNIQFAASVSPSQKGSKAVAIELMSNQFRDMLKRKAGSLSGGERSLLHLEIALLHAPKYLILDEPSAALDVERRASLARRLRRHTEDGGGILLCTHSIREVEGLADDAVILHRGRVVASGAIAELVTRFGNGLVDFMFEGKVQDLPVDTNILASEILDGGSTLRCFVSDTNRAVVSTAKWLADCGARVSAVSVVPRGLEAAFLAVTHGRTRADESE